jgi:parallel beta-helix repeat protein
LPSHEGVYVFGQGTTSNSVTGNTIEGNGFDGVLLEVSSSTTVAGDTIGGTASPQWDVHILDSPSNTVSGNALNDTKAVLLEYNPSDPNLAADAAVPPTSGNTINANVCGSGRVIAGADSGTGNLVVSNGCTSQ